MRRYRFSTASFWPCLKTPILLCHQKRFQTQPSGRGAERFSKPHRTVRPVQFPVRSHLRGIPNRHPLRLFLPLLIMGPLRLGLPGRCFPGHPRGPLPHRHPSRRRHGRRHRPRQLGDAGRMRLLYGVQGTGNGHITHARAMARELAGTDIEVTFLFSGRPKEELFDMEGFGDYLWRAGLTFKTRRGRVSYLRTALTSSPLQFLKFLPAHHGQTALAPRLPERSGRMRRHPLQCRFRTGQ